jgi:hypothetical protein
VGLVFIEADEGAYASLFGKLGQIPSVGLLSLTRSDHYPRSGKFADCSSFSPFFEVLLPAALVSNFCLLDSGEDGNAGEHRSLLDEKN